MVFARPLSDSSVAVALLNAGHFAGPHNITVDFNKVTSDPAISAVHETLTVDYYFVDTTFQLH